MEDVPEKKKPPFTEDDLAGWKYFKLIRQMLDRLHLHKDHRNRLLHYDEYVSLLLLYFFNPIVSSLRGIHLASTLKKVQKTLGVGKSSLGSLSEATGVFDPELLKEIFLELAGEASAADGMGRPRGVPDDLAVVAADATLLDALPRMLWALWLDEGHRAVKLHLRFDVLKGVPVEAEVGDGNSCERKALRESLKAGVLYVIDRGFAEYGLFQEIIDSGSSFVGRVQQHAVCEVVEERPLSDEAFAAGVEYDATVRLGGKLSGRALTAPLRLVKVRLTTPTGRGLKPPIARVSSKGTFRERRTEHELMLVTDRVDLPAETVAVLYRYRWQVELFFRWLKCVLGCRHLVAECESGVRIQLYAALIASLLIVIWTGRKPTKRTLEMIQFYFQGWADLDELEGHIASLKTAS